MHYLHGRTRRPPLLNEKHCNQGTHTTRSLFSALRFEFDDDKHQRPGDTAHFLGVSYDVSHFKAGVVYVRIKPERKIKIAAMLQEIITTQQMTKGQASSLRGKLFFACTQAFGRVGRAALQAFVRRQYSNETALTPALNNAITFFQQFIEHADAMPRTYYIDASPMPTILIWTDASWEKMQGMLGSVIYVPELHRFFYSYTSVPEWMKARWTQRMQKIGQAEILAAILPYLSIPVSQLHRRNIIHFVDNTSALSALLNGYTLKRLTPHGWLTTFTRPTLRSRPISGGSMSTPKRIAPTCHREATSSSWNESYTRLSTTRYLTNTSGRAPLTYGSTE